MTTSFGPRRAHLVTVADSPVGAGLSAADVEALEKLDSIYRRLVAALFNFVPTSGHPGGSLSSGRLAQALVFGLLDHDLSAPQRDDADALVYAAGHKALGMYALWAMRDEVARLGAPELLPDERRRLRFEDLLGFRRSPTTSTPLFRRLGAKALDGHPTPATPFVRLATGASGVGLASSIGLAWGLLDYYGEKAPRVHVIEGEAGLTPGRAAESLAAAGTARLRNVVLHVDWNQASIDSDRVCRDGAEPGDYVQWDPVELCHLHDWNVVLVPGGHDFRQIAQAQEQALAFDNLQPTAVVYRTIKGWRYGLEGARSHGAGHAFCSQEFYAAFNRDVDDARWRAKCWADPGCCSKGGDPGAVERCQFQTLELLRAQLKETPGLVERLAARLRASRARLDASKRRPRSFAPDLGGLQAAADRQAGAPQEFAVPGSRTTLREALARSLETLNRATGGGLLVAAADLLGSTSVRLVGGGFPEGFHDAASNPGARLLATGGICEDAMSGIVSGISMAGHHLGVCSSYAAFLAPLGHVAARLHAIGCQGANELEGGSARTMLLVCAHAGVETGEDGPTHADPQCLQLLQDGFPPGALVTLTPWDPQEVPVLLAAALRARPAVVAAFVTRPSKVVLDRSVHGLAPVAEAAKGVYRLRRAWGRSDGAVVLQGSEVAYAFLLQALPRLVAAGIELDVYYVASAELFRMLPEREQDDILPQRVRSEAIGITGFTLPTIWPWLDSARGRRASLHPLSRGFLGSGRAEDLLEQAGLDGASQYRQISRFLRGAP